MPGHPEASNLLQPNTRPAAILGDELDAGRLQRLLHLSKRFSQAAGLIVLQPCYGHCGHTCQRREFSYTQTECRSRHPNLVTCYHCI